MPHKTADGAPSRHFAPGLFAETVSVITGGGTGIGFATASLLCELGGRVALLGRRADVLAKAAAQLGETALAVPCDIREPDRVAQAVRHVLQRCGRIDILVNNAGGQFAAPAEAMSPGGFAAVVRNNLLGTYNVTREVAVHSLLQGHGGVVVNVIANVQRGMPGMVHTGAARAGIENMTRTLAVEWASRGVRVCAVSPGIIATEGVRQYPPELLKQGRRATPLQRLGQPCEVAYAIAYLASPLAAYVTGTTLHVDGGGSLWGDVWPIDDPDASRSVD